MAKSTDLEVRRPGVIVRSLAGEVELIEAAISRATRSMDTVMAARERFETVKEMSQAEVAQSLARIKAGELWREAGARSWSGWLKSGGARATGFLGGRVRAVQLAEAAPLLESGNQFDLVTNERQARELRKVPEPIRIEVVERALAGGKLTAASISRAAGEVASGPVRGLTPDPYRDGTPPIRIDSTSPAYILQEIANDAYTRLHFYSVAGLSNWRTRMDERLHECSDAPAVAEALAELDAAMAIDHKRVKRAIKTLGRLAQEQNTREG